MSSAVITAALSASHAFATRFVLEFGFGLSMLVVILFFGDNAMWTETAAALVGGAVGLAGPLIMHFIQSTQARKARFLNEKRRAFAEFFAECQLARTHASVVSAAELGRRLIVASAGVLMVAPKKMVPLAQDLLILAVEAASPNPPATANQRLGEKCAEFANAAREDLGSD